MPHLTVGSLFSGIGGLDLGLERAGMQVAWQVETDAYCQRVLRQHWSEVIRYDDIRRLNFLQIPRVDVIAGGPPCQPVSQAGKRRAQADERWLWPHFFRAVRDLRPEYVLLENPPGLLARGFSEVVGNLASIGYDAEWESIPATAFGALHRRFRTFVVAYPEDVRRNRGSVFGHPESAPRKELGNGTEAAPDTDSLRQLQPQGRKQDQRGRFDDGSWWATEPRVARMVHGLSGRVDRVKALGNSVVPQMAEWVGRLILQHAQRARSK